MKLKSIVAALVVAGGLVISTAPAGAHGIVQERETCKDGEWEHLSGINRGPAFPNQGQCVSHVSTGGTLFHAAS